MGDLPTAFAARAGSGPLHVVVCAEYDALPAVGHACGHNVIAAMAAGAGLALAQVADDAGLRVTVLGTPAEEGGGGKILLLERGAFDGARGHDGPPLAVRAGRDADHRREPPGGRLHRQGGPRLGLPFLGVNAADALVVAQTAIGLLRQHLRAGDRVHGIVTKGGDAANIIGPHRSGWSGRPPWSSWRGAGQGDPLLRGRRPGHRGDPGAVLGRRPYSEMRHDHDLSALYQRNAEALGRTLLDRSLTGAPGRPTWATSPWPCPRSTPPSASTPCPPVNHQPEFTKCATPAADQAVVDGAVAMAWTAIDAAADPAASGSWPTGDVRGGPAAPTSLVAAPAWRRQQEETPMKYMILTYASQRDYDGMAGKPTGEPVWSAEDFAAMGAFMESFNQELAESGQLVETRGWPRRSSRRRLRPGERRAGGDGRAVRRGPGGPGRLLDRGMRGFDRATEARRPAGRLPGPGGGGQRRGRRPADRRLPGRPGALSRPLGGTEVEGLLRRLAPQVLGALVRRYGHFDTAEDATQEALLAAALQWPQDGVPDNPARLADHGGLAPALTDLLRSEQAAGAARTTSAAGPVRSSGWRPPPTGPRRRPTTTPSSCCSCAAIERCRRPRRSPSPCGRSAA